VSTREYPNDPEDVPRDPPLRPVITPPTGAPLVDAATAAYHLRIALPLSTEAQTDLTSKIQAASDAIRDYLKSGTDPAWDVAATNVPAIVQQAVLLLLTNYWEHRGDDGAPNDSDAASWNAIKRLLMRQRDPALA
jgi:hypothetical protein